MTTPHLTHAASTYVFRLLGRGRGRAQRAPGSALDATLAALRESGQSALIEVELASGSLGRLLVQVGRLVYAQYEGKAVDAALAEIQEGAAGARLYSLRLSAEQIIFACAALAGIPLALGEPLNEGPEHLPALLTQLTQQGFTGVVALEQGLETLIWRFQRGRILNTVKLPARIRAGRLTQIVWQEQILHEIGEAAPPQAQPNPVQPSPAPSSAQLTVTRSAPAPIQTTSAGTPSSRPAPVPSAPVRHTEVHNTEVHNTEVHNTEVHNIPGQDTPVRNTSIRHAAMQNAATQNTAMQNTYVQNTSVRNTSIQTTSVQTGAGQNTSVPRTQVGSSHPPRQRKQQEPQGDTEEVWAQFRSVLYAQLGSRAERVFGLMYGELGGFSRAELIKRLTGQVERIAGSAAARNFRDSF